MAHVLVLDDEPGILRAFRRILETAGHEVETFESGLDALDRARASTFDVVISDFAMPGLDGVQFLRRVREIDADVPLILVSAQATLQSAFDAVELGAFRYLEKPVDHRALQELVARAAALRRMATLKRQAQALAQNEALGDLRTLPARLQAAMDGLWMAFQPIVSWSARRTVAFEALLRTDEPTLRNPALLLEAAQQLARLPELGRKIRNKVAAELASAPSDARIFVNLHPIDLLDDDLADPAAPLSAHAGRVVLEITERAALDSVSDVNARVQRLRALGFRVAIDDLGAGYAGLGHFAQLEPEVVKLDMSLVRGVDVHPTKQRVVRSMIQLCRELRIEVVAEGIETPGERDVLASLGCENMQGYLFARPAKGFAILSSL